MIQLVPYHEQYKERLVQFYQPDEALKYTQLPAVSIQQIGEKVHGVVILLHNTPIGFFLLNETDKRFEYTDDKHAILLTSLIMDHRFSSKGHGKHGMLQLPIYINKHYKHIHRVVLGVNHANIPAQKLYERIDFEDTGRRIEGPIGEQYIYELKL